MHRSRLRNKFLRDREREREGEREIERERTNESMTAHKKKFIT